MTAAILTALAVSAVVTIPAVLLLWWDGRRSAPFNVTTNGHRLAEFITEQYALGNIPREGTVYVESVRHPCGAYLPKRVITEAQAAEELAAEAEAMLRGDVA